MTVVEFTLAKSGVDFYDVSMVNGFNIAAEMRPIDPPSESADQAYKCGNPGGTKSLGKYGACTWDFSPPSNDLRWVEAVSVSDGSRKQPQVAALKNKEAKDETKNKDNEVLDSVACVDDSECASEGTVCGMNGKGSMICGELRGYWTLDAFCGQNLGSSDGSTQCDMPLPNPNEGQTLRNILGCAGTPSCYQQETAENCCGCQDWQDEISEVDPRTETCVSQNPNWLQYVKPSLKFLKEACPSAYTYPCDDMSSTYTCSSEESGGGNHVIAGENRRDCR